MTGAERCKQSGDAGGGFADEFDAGWALAEKDRADGFEFAEDGFVKAAGEFFQKPREPFVEPENGVWRGGIQRSFRMVGTWSAGEIFR